MCEVILSTLSMSYLFSGRLSTNIIASHQTSLSLSLYSLRSSSSPVYHTTPSPMTALIYSTSHTTKSQSTTQIMPTSSLNVLTSSQYSSILPTTNVTSTMLITTTPTTNFITTEQTTSFSATTKGIVKETTVAKVVSLGVTDIPTNDTLSTTTTTTATKYSNSVSITESHTDFGKSSTGVWKTEQATSPLYQGRFII